MVLARRTDHVLYSTPIITSDALIMTTAQSPTFKPSSSTASFVIDEVMICSCVISTRTCAVVIPFLISIIFPLILLRALSFIGLLRTITRGCIRWPIMFFAVDQQGDERSRASADIAADFITEATRVVGRIVASNKSGSLARM